MFNNGILEDVMRMLRSRTARAEITLLVAISLAGDVAGQQSQPPPACNELAVLAIGAGSELGTVCRVDLTLPDAHVSLLGASLPPAAGLASRASFVPAGDSTLVVGDVVVMSSELPAVVRALAQSGFAVAAVHRHMLGETPAISFVHFTARGDARGLARGLRQSIGPPIRPRTTTGGEALVGQPGFITGVPCTVVRDAIAPGEIEAGPGFCRLGIPRTDVTVSLGGTAIPSAIVATSVVSFRETPDRTSIVLTGNFVLDNPGAAAAIARLAEGGIDVVAVHDRMPGLSPSLSCVHFQARGNAIALAATLHTALDGR